MMLNMMTVVEDWYLCLDGNPGHWDRYEDRIDVSLRRLLDVFRRTQSTAKFIVFYLHPWEIDPDHPRIPLNPGLKLRHYCALGKTEEKLERRCTDFRFASINRVLDV